MDTSSDTGSGILWGKTKGNEFILDKAVECYIQNELVDNSIPLDEIIQETARILSGELLYMKFLQGIPIVGVVGGAFDFKYMKEITTYAEIKYRKRYYRNLSEYDMIEKK